MQDSKGLMAITLSILVFIVWYSFIAPKFWPQEGKKTVIEEAMKETGGVKEVAETVSVSEPTDKVSSSNIPQKDIQEVVSKFDTKYFEATFSSYGAVPTSWRLKKYTVAESDSKELVDLIPATKLPRMPLSLFLEKSDIPDVPRFTLVEGGEGILRYSWSSKEMTIEKTYTLGKDEYDINLEVTIENRGKESVAEQPAIAWSAVQQEEKKGGFFGFLKRPSDIRMPVYMLDGKVNRESNTSKIEMEEIRAGSVYWAGIEDRYFIAAVVPRSGSGSASVTFGSFGNGGKVGFYSGMVMPESAIPPGGSEKYNFTVYAGPKEMQTLKAVGMNLEKAIDFGWFTVIAIPILYVLKFLYSIVHNYGIAIILLTILIKILLHPISKKSMKSMKAMQKLQPQLKELKEKYKGNKERLNMETMQLFKTHKVNPMSGCLPMVLQFPVYIALYRVLWNSIELYHAPFFWFYKDLSQPDPYFITPVLLGVAMFLQQKMTPSATADPTQQKMMMMMPLMFSVFLAFLPVGLVIYILVNTAVTVVQQWMSNNDIRFRDLVRGQLPYRAKS